MTLPQPIRSLTDFGALGVGNDTQVCVAAFRDLQQRRGTLVIPPGVFLIDCNTIHQRNLQKGTLFGSPDEALYDCVVVGAGPTQSVFKWNGVFGPDRIKTGQIGVYDEDPTYLMDFSGAQRTVFMNFGLDMSAATGHPTNPTFGETLVPRAVFMVSGWNFTNNRDQKLTCFNMHIVGGVATVVGEAYYPYWGFFASNNPSGVKFVKCSTDRRAFGGGDINLGAHSDRGLVLLCDMIGRITTITGGGNPGGHANRVIGSVTRDWDFNMSITDDVCRGNRSLGQIVVASYQHVVPLPEGLNTPPRDILIEGNRASQIIIGEGYSASQILRTIARYNVVKPEPGFTSPWGSVSIRATGKSEGAIIQRNICRGSNPSIATDSQGQLIDNDVAPTGPERFVDSRFVTATRRLELEAETDIFALHWGIWGFLTSDQGTPVEGELVNLLLDGQPWKTFTSGVGGFFGEALDANDIPAGTHTIQAVHAAAQSPSLTITGEGGIPPPPPPPPPPTVPLIPQSQFRIVRVDSEETDPAYPGQGFGIFAIDGNPATFWLTQWVLAQPPHPHEIVLDLGGTYDVFGFRYLPRQDSFQRFGTIKDYAFYVSTDGASWGSPVLAGAFAADFTEKDAIALTGKTGRFVRLVALSDIVASPHASAAELNVFGEAVTPPPPPPPVVLSASSGDGQAQLTWTPSAGASGYRIWRSTIPGSELPISTVPGDTIQFLDVGLVNGTTYYYVVTAFNPEAESGPSNEVSATPQAPPPPPPPPPGNPVLSASVGDSQVLLTWTPPSGAVTAYRVYRGTQPSQETLLTTVFETSYRDLGLTNDVTYYYIVTAFNDAGEGSPSNEISATPKADLPPPPPPELDFISALLLGGGFLASFGFIIGALLAPKP